MPSEALAGIRVAELGEGVALAYAGKLFADLGAAVVKLERAGGDPARQVPPLVTVAPGVQESGVFAWLNTNKRSVTTHDLGEISRRSKIQFSKQRNSWL